LSRQGWNTSPAEVITKAAAKQAYLLTTKTYLDFIQIEFQFILQTMFASIFNTYHGAPILCYTTTDLGNFWYCSWDFGVAFVRALNATYTGSAR